MIIGGRPIDDIRVYTGATNSYFAGFTLRRIPPEPTGCERVDVVPAYLREKGSVTPAYDGRRIVIGRPSRSGG